MDDMMPRPSQVEIGLERWNDIWPEAKPLMLAHRAELGQDDPRAEFSPDHQQINKLESYGGLQIVTARADGSLVGYSICYLMPSLESAGLMMAMMAPWYVAPAWRSRGIGGCYEHFTRSNHGSATDSLRAVCPV